MRTIKKLQLELGETAIENIKFNPKSRDDIPALLIGLQHIYSDPVTREELFSLLEEKFSPEVNLKVGRPGMDIWRVVVLGVLKQGLGCDFDRLCSLANSYKELRQMLGHSDYEEQYLYDMRRIVDNVSLLTPELLNEIGRINYYKAHAVRQIDQVRRRIIHGEVIPQEEKVFSVFEPHTRWIVKGKAGVPVELGVPVCIVEDQYQFILNHRVMWEQSDVDVCVPFIEETKRMYPEFEACSFDQGFHSPKNRKSLDEILEGNYLPKKGKLGKKDKQRQGAEEFKEARKQHPAVESAINGLNHKGCDKVRVHGKLTKGDVEFKRATS